MFHPIGSPSQIIPTGIATSAQRDAYMRSVWEGLVDDVEIAEVHSTYDADRNELRMSMSGSVKLDWVSGGVRRAEIPISRISWDAGERREPGPFRDAPFSINYPANALFRTTIILPDGGEGGHCGHDCCNGVV